MATLAECGANFSLANKETMWQDQGLAEQATHGGIVEYGANNEAWPIVIDSSGRISFPAEARRTFGWETGTRLVIERLDGVIRVVPLDEFIERVQNHFSTKFGPDRDMVDELMQERRMEAERDESRY